MLRHTFQHIPGLGERRERGLWRRGILTWDDLLAAPQRSGLPATLLHDAEAIIHLSQEALLRGNIISSSRNCCPCASIGVCMVIFRT